YCTLHNLALRSFPTRRSSDLDAENILLRMKEKYPDDYTAYLQLAWVYLEKEGNKYELSRNYDKILEYYNLAIQFAPQGQNTSDRSEEHTSELQSRFDLVCRLL